MLVEIYDPDKLSHQYEFKYADFTIQVHGTPMSPQNITMMEFIASKVRDPILFTW